MCGVRREFEIRVRMLLWSIVQTVLAAACTALFALMVTGTALIAVWVGVPIVLGTVLVVRPVAELHRRFTGSLLGAPIESPYLRAAGGNMLLRLRAVLKDPATWRDTVWLLVNGTVGLLLSTLAIVEGVLDLLFWWLPRAVFIRLDAHIARALLTPSEKSRLALRVQALTESRAETVDTQAAELRRIERDLHDGAQARLVSLGMSLGMAEEQFGRDPEGARQLLAEARANSTAALAELRDLVRGIHPPVLADRGLVGAVQALALAGPLPVDVAADLPERLPAPAESAAYFAVAEAITNVVKHSGATHAWVRMVHAEQLLRIEVGDDGVGGAAPERGTGLRGIERRLSAFDGRLTVISPPGGPTTLTMELPCASSSPKISPSSGTD
jgi:signal transduction histidine kinase